MLVRVYLRASTDEQDANRARTELQTFADERGLKIAKFYTENESGAKLDRPKLFELLNDCQPNDILLTEQVDRISRLTESDWKKLCVEIDKRQVRIVSLDLPTSWTMASEKADEFTKRMFEAINKMMLDMLAAVARKDYEDRRRRVEQGQAKAKAEGRYTGRKEDVARNNGIAAMLAAGHSYSFIVESMKVSRPTIAKIAKRQRDIWENRI